LLPPTRDRQRQKAEKKTKRRRIERSLLWSNGQLNKGGVQRVVIRNQVHAKATANLWTKVWKKDPKKAILKVIATLSREREGVKVFFIVDGPLRLEG